MSIDAPTRRDDNYTLRSSSGKTGMTGDLPMMSIHHEKQGLRLSLAACKITLSAIVSPQTMARLCYGRLNSKALRATIFFICNRLQQDLHVFFKQAP
jgi:hypothetical protein